MKKANEEKTLKVKPKETNSISFAVVRIRSINRINIPINDTLKMLRLYRRNYCVVLDNTPSISGMLNKVKDYITWGEIDDETLSLLKEKREEKTKDEDGKEVTKKFFRLNPPRGGFGRKGIKFQFKAKGALGYRGSKINDLIRRMI